MTRNGMATNASATTTPVVVNGKLTPNVSYSQAPSSPRRPKTSSSAIPPTTGGSTSGTVTSARTSRRPGKSTRARSHASGTPTSRHARVASVAVCSDSRSAVRMPGWASRPGRVLHGARTTRPASGSTRNARPRPAGTISATGTRDVPRRRGTATGGASTGSTSTTIGLRCLEPGRGEYGPALAGQYPGDEGLRAGLVGSALQHDDRVLVDGRRGLGELHTVHIGHCGPGVGAVHQGGVHLTELDLGQGGLDVLLLGDRSEFYVG